jgi:hypothetical protein
MLFSHAQARKNVTESEPSVGIDVGSALRPDEWSENANKRASFYQANWLVKHDDGICVCACKEEDTDLQS